MKVKKMVSGVLACSMFFSLFGVSYASSVAVEQSQSMDSSLNVNNLNEEKIDEIIPFLKAIESIPDALIKKGNPQKINKYFKRKGVIVKTYNDKVKIRSKRGAWSCGLAIGVVIVTNAIPVAKIARIKAYIKSLGGLKETVKLMLGATTGEEKLVALGLLLAELTEFDKVQEECFE